MTIQATVLRAAATRNPNLFAKRLPRSMHSNRSIP